MNNNVINITGNLEKYTLQIKKHLIYLLQEKGFTCSEEFNPNAKLNITIGGDGAFLRGVRDSNFTSTIPFIGINTGTLGFYPEINPTQIEQFIDDYINEDYRINEISLIESEIVTKEITKKIYAVNDIVIKRMDMKTIHLNVFIDKNNLEKISGDGLIISSPMGSSGYNLSSGGSLVYPSLKTLQITPLSPIISNAYRCLNTSIIVPPEFEITIYPERKEDYYIYVLADGVSFEFDGLEHANFRTSKSSIKMLTTGTFNYWDVIKEKFL